MAKMVKMSWFANQALKDKVMKMEVGQAAVAGQILGVVFAVKEREIVSPDGEVSKSLQVMGDFEAKRMLDGMETRAGTAYLPRYFAEELQAVLERNGGRPQPFAVNVLLERINKNIPFSWIVEPVMERPEDDPITRMKKALAEAGKLELSPPKGFALPKPEDEEVDDDEIPVSDKKPARKK